MTINGSEFQTIEAFTAHADAQGLSRDALQAIYDAIPGVKEVKRLRNRPYAIERIWEETARLNPEPAPVAEPERREKTESRRIDAPDLTPGAAKY